MNLKKYMVLIVGCGIAFVMAIGAAVLLFLQMSANAKAQSELKSTMAKLEKLNKRQPYPNQANVDKISANLASLKTKLSESQALLRTGQVENEQIEAAQFGPLLEKTIRLLNKKAESSSVALPANFAFGFESYSAGALPATGVVVRLVTQLKTVASLCNVLYAAKVTNILSITRDEFETSLGRDAASAGSASTARMFGEASYVSAARPGTTMNIKNIPVVASNDLFTIERVGMEFVGRENAVWEVCNALVKGPPFCIVRDLSLDNSAAGGVTTSAAAASVRPGPASISVYGRGGEYPGIQPGMPTAQAAITNALMTPREERVVAGRELVRASLIVDVYQFATGKGETK